MGTVFSVQKCACGGNLKYDQSKKCFICEYCGMVVEREATIDKIKVDGIETVGDIVRATLISLIYEKKDEAEKSLGECVKKGYNYVGTMIAKICYQIYNFYTAMTKEEAKFVIEDLKKTSKDFYENNKNIGVDEINLYESFSKSDNAIFGFLYIVYDVLSDKERKSFVSNKIKWDDIDSKFVNKNIVNILLKDGRNEELLNLLKNENNIDKGSIVKNILLKGNEELDKISIVKNILASSNNIKITSDDIIEYIEKSNDEKKIDIITLLYEKLDNIDIAKITISILPFLQNEIESKQFFQAIYKKRISDEDNKIIINKILSIDNAYILKSYIQVLDENKILVLMDVNMVSKMIEGLQISDEELLKIIESIYKIIPLDDMKDAICRSFLLGNTNVERKIHLIDYILSNTKNIKVATVKEYVISKNNDGKSKIDFTKKIFDNNFKMSFVPELLYEYMIKSNDEYDVEEEIVKNLISIGFSLDSKEFINYINSKNDTNEEMKKKCMLLLNNGMRVKNDTLQNYILSIDEKDFSSEIFKKILEQDFIITFQIYKKYLLKIDDKNKGICNDILIKKFSKEEISENVIVDIENVNIITNILFAYILSTKDEIGIVEKVINSYFSNNIKLKNEIICDNRKYKLNKFLIEFNKIIRQEIVSICEKYNF